MKVGSGQPITKEQRDLIALLKSRYYWNDLSDWSKDFLESISKSEFLSVKQAVTLENIHRQFDAGPDVGDGWDDWK